MRREAARREVGRPLPGGAAVAMVVVVEVVCVDGVVGCGDFYFLDGVSLKFRWLGMVSWMGSCSGAVFWWRSSRG